MQPLKEFINKNIILFVIAITIFAVGIIAGSIVASDISIADRNQLREQLSDYVSVSKAKKLTFSDVFVCECINHLRFVPVMFLFSLSTLFIAPGAIMMGVRGYQLGFSISFVCMNFGKNGILITMASAIFSYFITIPIYLMLFALSANYAIERNKFKSGGRCFASLLILFLIAYSILCAAAALEGILLPIFIDFLN